MTEPKLIRITNANRKEFYDLFMLQPFDNAAMECTWLQSKHNVTEQNLRVDAFLNTERANVLQPIPYNRGKGLLYAHGGTPPRPLPPVAKTHPDYSDYIQALRRMVSVNINDDGTITVEMDPLPVGEEIAILFQNDSTKPWEVATAKTIEKSVYLDQLLAPQSNIPGLPMQLGITEFANGTKVLQRFFLSADENGIYFGTTTLHRIDPRGKAHAVLTNEDFMMSQFIRPEHWLALQEQQFGPATAFHRVTSSAQCRPFVNREGQFSISKTGMKRADGTSIFTTGDTHQIKGRFLQQDFLEKPVIQDPNASVLEQLMHRIFRKAYTPPLALETPDTTTVIHDGTAKQAIRRWVGRDVQHVSKINDNVTKIHLENNAYLLDKGQQLSLHGSDEEKHLELMVEHARDHWNKKLQIDQASPEVRRKLEALATKHGVTIIRPAPAASPTRPSAPRIDPTTGHPLPAAA